MESKSNNRSRGSITIEATIIVPVVIFTIITLIYICMLLYQQVYVQAVANKAAENGAVMWISSFKDMNLQEIKKEDFKEITPYWRFCESKKEDKIKKIQEYISHNIEKFSIVGRSRKCTSSVGVSDFILYKKLLINVKHTYDMPTGTLLKAFGLGSVFTVNAKAEAIINEPAEFIRNTDFIIDTMNQVDISAGSKLSKTTEKIMGLFQSLSGKLSAFLD